MNNNKEIHNGFKLRDIHMVVIWNCSLLLLVMLSVMVTSSCTPLWALLLVMGIKVDHCKKCGKEMKEDDRCE